MVGTLRLGARGALKNFPTVRACNKRRCVAAVGVVGDAFSFRISRKLVVVVVVAAAVTVARADRCGGDGLHRLHTARVVRWLLVIRVVGSAVGSAVLAGLGRALRRRQLLRVRCRADMIHRPRRAQQPQEVVDVFHLERW